MKIFHTADWHLGKLLQGVSMIEEQRYILRQFIDKVREEKPDVVIIAGDLYDRAVPPPDAVQLLNDVLDEIVVELRVPVIAIAGNHDSPNRIHFGSNIMRDNGFHIVGKIEKEQEPIVLSDEYGEVHFHLVPYCDPSIVRKMYKDDSIKSYDDATKAITDHLKRSMDKKARHVYVGHAFVTPFGEAKENTSESERPLSIGGVEYVNAKHFENFHYTALGHLHQAHYVVHERIRYAGSPLKYSLSEEHHKKGFYQIEMDEKGDILVEKILLKPRHDIRSVEMTINEILQLPINEDYVFVRLIDETPVLSPMEKVRSVFPNAMHVERKHDGFSQKNSKKEKIEQRHSLTDVQLFKAFYKEVKGFDPSKETEEVFMEILETMLQIENETIEIDKFLMAKI